MKAGYRERALIAFPAGSNGEYGIPADLVPVLQRGNEQVEQGL